MNVDSPEWERHINRTNVCSRMQSHLSDLLILKRVQKDYNLKQHVRNLMQQNLDWLREEGQGDGES